MTTRTIQIERSALYDICDALNSQAAHYDWLAINTAFPASVREMYQHKAHENRRLTASLLDSWDAAQAQAA